MANIPTVTKSPGDQHTSTELNNQTNWTNSPWKDLGAFNPAMTFDSQGGYDKYTLTGNIVLNASGIVNGLVRKLWIETDGVSSVTLGTGFSAGITDLTNVITAGTYLFMFASFKDESGVSKVVLSAPNITFVSLTAPAILQMSVEDAEPNDLVVIFNEAVTATNVGYSFRVDAGARALSAVSGAGTNTLTFTISGGALTGGEVLDLTYDSVTGDTLNATLVELVSFTQSSVTNNVGATYTFANTHKMVISGIGDGISIQNPACYPSDGAGNDEAVSYEIWGTTQNPLLSPAALMRLIDDSDDFIISDVGFGGGQVSTSFRTDGSNRIVKTSDDVEATAALLHVIVTKPATENYADVKIYVNGSEVSAYTDGGVGTYTGMRALSGNLIVEFPRLNLNSGFETYQLFRQFDAELTGGEVTILYNAGTPVGLTSPLQAKCVQENLLNNNPNADNIGINGINQASVSYALI